MEEVQETIGQLAGALVLIARLGDYSIALEPEAPQVPVGPVVFEVVNDGFVRHALRVEGLETRTSTLNSGGSEALAVTFPVADDYVLFCDIGFHAGAGMVATLQVTHPDAPAEPSALTGR